MILPRHKLRDTLCIGHVGLGEVREDGRRCCALEKCIAYRRVVTYIGDIWASMTPEENAAQKQLHSKFEEVKLRVMKEVGIDKSDPARQSYGYTEAEWKLLGTNAEFVTASKAISDYSDSMWQRYGLGTCGLAGHSQEEIDRRAEGQAYADG